MKKYLRLICDTCNRTIDRLVDNERALPDRCVITLSCQGRLFPVEYRSNSQITPAAQVGVVDWYPRGQTPTAGTSPQEPVLLDTSTGDFQQLVLALKLETPPADTQLAQLTLAIRSDTPKVFKQYVYQRDVQFTIISGTEDGIEKKTLKFQTWGPDADLVEVYLKGEKLEEGPGPDQFQVDNGTPSSPAPPNTVRFNTEVSPVGTYQIDVIVSKVRVDDSIQLQFHRNRDDPNRLETGAWENVSYIERFSGTAWEKFYLFTYDVKGNNDLTKDTILNPINDVVLPAVGTVARANAFFAIARKPFTQLDRYPDISAVLSTFGVDRDFLKYHETEGELRLELTETSLSTFFPPSRVIKFNPEKTIKVYTPGEDEQVVVDGKVIVGPDT